MNEFASNFGLKFRGAKPKTGSKADAKRKEAMKKWKQKCKRSHE